MVVHPRLGRGAVHHIELRVNDLVSATSSWEWLLVSLGYAEFQRWPEGISWILDGTYLVLEQAPRPGRHDRRDAGLNHLAFQGGERSEVDALWEAAPSHGWRQLYADRYPWAGGEPDDQGRGPYAAFIENEERFVATDR